MQSSKLAKIIRLVGNNVRVNALVTSQRPPDILNHNHVCLVFSPVCRFTTTSTDQVNPSIQTKSNQAQLEFKAGLTKLILKLPARGEDCEFNLKLINETVSDLIDQIKIEDKSVEKVVFYSNDGVRVAQNTSLGILVSKPFQIKINDISYDVQVPRDLVKESEVESQLDTQAKKELEQIKQLVSKLYLHLNVEQYELEREQIILKQLEQLKSEIAPLEEARKDLALKSKRHTNRMIWLGLGAMSIQMGIMARLTWFDYSWDIVEPISYFVSYSAVIGVYAYFVLTRKEYDYESASDRIFLRHFHKNASKYNLDVNQYNEIRSKIFLLERDLLRIKESHLKNLTIEKPLQNKNL